MNFSNLISKPFRSQTLIESLQRYIEREGTTFASLSDAFSIAAIMADYAITTGVNFDSLVDNNFEKIYSDITTYELTDENGRKLNPMDAVGLLDYVNDRTLYVVVLRPGKNMVFFQKSGERDPVDEIGFLGPKLIKRGLRMEPTWKGNNNFDKVMLAQTFGFDYDKKDDKIIVPLGRVESDFALNKLIHAETIEELKAEGFNL